MKQETKNNYSIFTVAVFALLIFGLLILHLIIPDSKRSKSERRLLTQIPAFSAQTLFSGNYIKQLESYLLDQFPIRDGFRSAKALMNNYAFRRLDNNGIYTIGDSIYKLGNTIDTSQVIAGTDKVNKLIDAYMASVANIYISVIPDKSWYASGNYPKLDYDYIAKTVRNNAPRADFIDISNALSAKSYYRTDTHWRQDKLQGVLDALAKKMNWPTTIDLSDFSANALYPFEGVYLGQSALMLEPDTLLYLSNPKINSASVWSVEKPNTPLPLYTLDKFTEALDGYDIFLDGAAALLKITNEKAETNRSLILFRDSFGSSVAPLLCGIYKDITLVDLRYISSELLGEHINFHNADVLFLYSASMWNSAKLFK